MTASALLTDGGPGSDTIYADDFQEALPRGTVRVIRGGAGQDEIQSFGAIPDDIRVRDGEEDYVNCGEGRDTVRFDKGLDRLKRNCEERMGG